ncbi:MAG: FtsX-like permease family protein [bacterium]
MFKFLIKGILRDKQRSLFPVIVVSGGVMLTVVMNCWIQGFLSDFIKYNARFSTGHVKIVTRAYAENMEQMPNDLALLGVEELKEKLEQTYPDMSWVNRIRFAGLMDVPDEQGETREQGPAAGLGIDMLSDKSSEIQRFKLKESLKSGRIPSQNGEILISEMFAEKLNVRSGKEVTIISSTMYGSMAMHNFTIVGTIAFGVRAMDRSAVIVDISDARQFLDMKNGSSEILGYFNNNLYDDEKAQRIKNQFNKKYTDPGDEFSPVMLCLKEQNDLAEMMNYYSHFSGIITSVFLVIMSIVLWNAGLIGGLRRYGEIGLRLAMGETKFHVHSSMILESVSIGIIGSVFGTALGLAISWYLQTYGVDIGSMMKDVTMMMPTVFRARIGPEAYYIGFIPGLFSTVLGTSLAGIGIYRRSTARLFKELEV